MPTGKRQPTNCWILINHHVHTKLRGQLVEALSRKVAASIPDSASNRNEEVKFTPRTGYAGPEGEYMYSSTVSLTSTLDGAGAQCHALPDLPPRKNWYPLYRKLDGSHGLSGRERKTSPPSGIRSPDRPARNESLYRLSYPRPQDRCFKFN